MRFFIHPETIIVPFPKVDGSVDPKPFTFTKFFNQIMQADERTAKSYKAIIATQKVLAIVDASKPGDQISIEDADFDFIKSIFEAPTCGYVPHVAKYLLPWIGTIVEATTVSPTIAATPTPKQGPSKANERVR